MDAAADLAKQAEQDEVKAAAADGEARLATARSKLDELKRAVEEGPDEAAQEVTSTHRRSLREDVTFREPTYP